MDRNLNCEYMATLLNRNSMKKTKEVRKPVVCNQHKFPRDRTSCPFTKPVPNPKPKVVLKRSKSQSRISDQKNWSTMFQQSKNGVTCGDPEYILNDFDPYHVLSFLSNEMKLRLAKTSTSTTDNSLFRLVTSMQNIIEKLPFSTKSRPSSQSDTAAQKSSKCVQATICENYGEAKNRKEGAAHDKKLNDEFDLLEEKYKNLMTSWEQLHMAKIDLEQNLHLKATDVLELREQLNQLKKDKNERYEPVIRKMQLENKKLKSELKNMENMQKMSQELMNEKNMAAKKYENSENQAKLIEKLNSQLTIVEQENRLLKDQMNIMKLTEEKTNVILSAKTVELNEIKKDINLIKELTNREKTELQLFNQMFSSKNSFTSNKLLSMETDLNPNRNQDRNWDRNRNQNENQQIQTVLSRSEISSSFKDFNEDISTTMTSLPLGS